VTTLSGVDASALYRDAGRVEDGALELRARAAMIGRQLEQTSWYSPAAVAGRTRVHDLIGGLFLAAARLDAFAESLRVLALKASQQR
jgi:hypothetical protein